MTAEDVWLTGYFGTGIIIGIVAVFVLNRTDFYEEGNDFEMWIMTGMMRFLTVIMSMLIWPLALIGLALKWYYESSRRRVESEH